MCLRHFLFSETGKGIFRERGGQRESHIPCLDVRENYLIM